MLSRLEQKPRQKNERQKNGAWDYASAVDDEGIEQTANIPLGGIMTNLISRKAGRIIFLPSIFLSSGFCSCYLNVVKLDQIRRNGT